MTQRVWLITGVSSGFGRHLTEQLLARGERVVGTVRKPTTVEDLAKAHPDGFRAEVLDVRDTAALRAVIDRTVADFGRIDVAISNAGYGVFGAAEELSDEQIEAILATNLTASIQFIRAVLPPMRSAGGGRIIQMSTYGGQVAFPGNSLYHATKWGIEGFCESVAKEVAPFGIGLTIVEPGGARTEFRYGSAQVADALPPTAAPPPGRSNGCSTRPTGWHRATPPAWLPPSSTASTRPRPRCGWCSDRRRSPPPSRRSRAASPTSRLRKTSPHPPITRPANSRHQTARSRQP